MRAGDPAGRTPHHLISISPEAAARLRALVEESGMTRERVAQAAGCPPGYLDDVLTGRKNWIHPDVLRDLSRVLHTFPAGIRRRWTASVSIPGTSAGSSAAR